MPEELRELYNPEVKTVHDSQQSIGCINARPGKKIYAYIQQQEVCLWLLANVESIKRSAYTTCNPDNIRFCFNKKNLDTVQALLLAACLD